MATPTRHLFTVGTLLAATLVALPARAALVIGCGQTVQLVTQRRDDVEQLVFDADENEVVSITVAAAADAPPKLNPEFFLESPAGDRVPFSDGSQICASVLHQCETQPLPATGTYTIDVRDAGRNEKGPLFVTLEAVSATADGLSNGPDDGPACRRINLAGKADGTQPLMVETSAGGTIDSPGETDTFTFLAVADQMVAIHLAPVLPAAGGFDPRAVLFDPAGQLVGDVCLAGETCTVGPLVPGVHTVKVFDIDYGGVGDYTLLVANPPPPPPSSTTTTTITPTTDPGAPSTTTTLPSQDEEPYTLSRTLRRQLATGEALGSAIAADASRIAIGVPFDQTGGPPSGRAYVVDLDSLPAPPNYTAPLLSELQKPGGSTVGDRFGASVALLDGQGVAVGAPGASATAPSTVPASGAVFLYPGGNQLVWPAQTGAEFGAALTSQGSDLFVGAPAQDTGRVYYFAGASLSQVFGSVASDPGLAAAGGVPAGARFGSAIAVLQTQSSNLIAIGAPADDTGPGAVYLLDRTTGDWEVLRRPGASDGDRFGAAVAFVDGTLVIGAPGVGKAFRLLAGQVADLGLPAFASLGASLAPVPGGKFLVGAPDAQPESVVLLVDLLNGLEEVRWSHKPLDGFGRALAAAGGRVFIASPDDDAGSVNGGAVFVYSGMSVEPVAVLRKREVDAGFGSAVAGNDGVVAVGAPRETGVGAVYAFQPAGCVSDDTCLPTWSLLGAETGAGLGQSVALIASAALVGAPFADSGNVVDTGAAFLAGIGQTDPPLTIPHDDPEAHEQFGFSVAAIGTDLLVGLPGRGEETDTGEVRIFDSETRALRTKLANPLRSSGDFFGAALAVDGDAVAVGAPFDSTAAEKSGAVYLFERASAKLVDTKPLVSPLGGAREMFGAAVAMDPDWIVVGAPALSGESPALGNVYVFGRQSRGFVCTIVDPRSEAGDSFGASVALVDGRVAVGAPLANDVQPQSGAAYLFDPGTCALVWTFAHPDASLGGDRFGASVSAAPAGLAIGAPGIGKVYVYTRNEPQGMAAVLSMVRDVLVPTAIAAGPLCGNGVVDAGEVCDDGNDVDTDDCRNDCSGGFCCVIDPTAAQRCNDFDPCTTDGFDPVTNRCVNVDNGTCCMSDNACAGQNGVCRICAGCSLFHWDCCDQGAACVLSSPECQGLTCFEQPLCECQRGLSCSEPGAEPTEAMTEAFRQSCDVLRLQEGGPRSDNPLGQARASVKASRRALRKARNKTRQAYRDGDISKACRGEYLDTIRLVRKSIPKKHGELRSCVQEQAAAD